MIETRRLSGGVPALLAVRPLGWGASVAVAVAGVLVSWPIRTVDPGEGLDASWRASLQLAVHQHLAFGRDYVFTYGPLGFLTTPQLFVPALAALGFCFVALSQLALVSLLVRRLSALAPLWGALLAAYALAVLPLDLSELAPLALLAASILAVSAGLTGRRLLLFAVASGLLAGVELLLKANEGLVCVAFAAIALAALAPKVEPVAAALGAGVVAFGVGWLATGQALGDLPRWAHGVAQIVAGYTSAMAREKAGYGWEYGAVAPLAAAVLLLAWQAAARLPRRRRWGLLALVVVLAYASFKEGFVRHDGHSVSFFAALAVAVPFLLGPRSRLWALALAASALGWAVALHSSSLGVRSVVDPAGSVRRAAGQTLDFLDAGRRRSRLAEDRHEAIAALEIDSPFVRRLVGRRTVDVEPYEISAAWALGLRWHGEPVPQSYSAYTPYLDDLDARFLSGADAPARILREPDDALVDDHAISTESPAAWLATLCHYRQLGVHDRWQVLGRTAGSRCGAPRPLGTFSARAGTRVRVPDAAAGELVVARFSLPPAGDPVLSLLFKPLSNPSLVLAGPHGTQSFRMTPANAGQPVVVRVPKSAGYADGFGGELRARALTVRGRSGTYRVAFEAIPLRR